MFKQVYEDASRLKIEGADIRAITAWAVLGSFDWCTLLTKQLDCYEAGLFDVRAPKPRATALTKLIKSIVLAEPYNHPILEEEGWWKRPCRVTYEVEGFPIKECAMLKASQPLVIIGKTGTLGRAFARLCNLRGIDHILLGRDDLDITNPAAVEATIKELNPWEVINTAGYVKVDEAETNKDDCFLANSVAPKVLSAACNRFDVKFVTYSSDLVFNGKKNNPYIESDAVAPLNVYGQSKALAEEHVLANHPNALIVRTSAFFGPWDQYNFVYHALNAFKNNMEFTAASDVTISPTYVPDLVNTTLDLLLDDENGIWNLSNKGEVTWAMLAEEVAARTGLNARSFKPILISEMGLVAARPAYTVLKSEKGFELPTLDDALGRYMWQQEMLTL